MPNNEEELFVPPDVPWKKLSSTIADLKVPKRLSPVYAIERLNEIAESIVGEAEEITETIKENLKKIFNPNPAQAELGDYQLLSAGVGILPSISIFYHLVPEVGDESGEEKIYPTDRVLLLKVTSTLSGLSVGRRYSVRTSRPYDEPGTVEEVHGFRSLPCVGGIVNLNLICETGPSGRGPYIRDIYPRRQEMIVNETIGVETMERSSSRTAVTKQWNISGTSDIPIEGITAGVSGGYGETMTEEQARERSKKLSHITEVQHVHHVLTGYHLGTDRACMTIQARAFEAEHWEMLKGYRLVEGIQDFFLIVNVPNDIEVLKIRACLNLGWRGSVSKGSLVKARPAFSTPKTREMVERGFLEVDEYSAFDIYDLDILMKLSLERCNWIFQDAIKAMVQNENIENLKTELTKWRETYGTFLEISKWIDENLTENHLLSAYFCTEAEMPIKGYDIMEFIPPTAMPSIPSFEDTIVPTEPFFPGKSEFENLSRLNATNSMMFKAIASSSNVPDENRIPLDQSPYFSSVVFSDFMKIPRVQTSIGDLINKSVENRKKAKLKKRPKPKMKKRALKVRR